MLAFKRWIALGPVALLLLAGLPGCKTGTKWNPWKHSGCSSACATSEAACGDSDQAACGDSSKTVCADSHQSLCTSGKTACAETSSSSCLGKKASCATTSGCVCGVDGNGCLCGKGHTSGCTSACAATTACATANGCVSKPCAKTSCASLGCVTTGRPGYGPAGVTITPKAMNSQPHPANKVPANAQPMPMPMSSEPAIAPQTTELLNPEPLPEANAEEYEVPIPAPPAEAAATETLGNPFLRVSQTEELDNRDAASLVNPFTQEEAASQPRPVGQNLSRPWADALGLPAKTPEPVELYHGN